MNTLQQFNTLHSKFTQLDRLLLRKEGEYQAIYERSTQLKKEAIEEQAKVELYTRTSILVQKLAELARQDTLDKVATIVSKALQDIKDPDLSFRINYKIERNQPVVDFMVYNDKLKVEQDILLSTGGTLSDIIDFALRISLLLKWQPQMGKILVFDESFKHVGAPDRPALAGFMRELSEKLGVQMILVTHSPQLTSHAHKVFTVSHDGNKSSVVAREGNLDD